MRVGHISIGVTAISLDDLFSIMCFDFKVERAGEFLPFSRVGHEGNLLAFAFTVRSDQK